LKTLQQGSPQFLPRKGGHQQGRVNEISTKILRVRQQKESEENENTSNKGNIKNKVLAEEKQLTAGGGLSAWYSRTGCGTTLTPFKIFLRRSSTSSSVNSRARTIREGSSAPEYSKP
jgi:hypothetical protein